MLSRIIKQAKTKSIFNISIVSIGNILNAGFGVFFLIATAQVLTVEDFGKYSLLTSLLVANSKLMDFGTNSAYVTNSLKYKNDVFTSFIVLRVLLFIVCIPIAGTLLYYFGLATPLIIFSYIVGLVAYAINYTLFAIFQKQQNYYNTFLINTVPGIFKATFGLVIVLKLLHVTFEQAFMIFSLTMLTSSVFLFNKSIKVTFNKPTIKEIADLFKKAVPAGGAMLINVNWQAISNSVLKLTTTFTEVGVFSFANKIANVFSLIALSIFTVLLPKNTLRTQNNGEYDYKETVFIAGVLLLLAVGASIGASILVQFGFGTKYASSLGALYILIFAYTFNAINTFIENYFFVEDNTKPLVFLALLNLALFLAFVQMNLLENKILSVALAQLISNLIITVIVTGIVAKKGLRSLISTRN
ncbi:MAG: oligosaccharide flippase family protein [Patescibacteria group bacterium]